MKLKEIFKLVKSLLKIKKSSTEDEDDGRNEHTGRTVPETPEEQDEPDEPWDNEDRLIIDLDEKLESLSRLNPDEPELGDSLTNDDLDR